MKYTEPHPETSALISIDVQQDFTLPGSPLQIPGTIECLPQMRALLDAFRNLERPIIHVARLYLPDGSNVDLCRREMIEQGAKVVIPDTPGADLVDDLKPDMNLHLDANLLLSGELQQLGKEEWVLYKPRWDAFFKTRLEAHLRQLTVDTIVFCGCNFPNCPRSSIYGATMRDFRVVMVTDAVSGVYEKGLEELRNIGVTLMNASECIAWVSASTTLS